ncbi:MAG: carboxypeptidase regulatory-like domain-containing protein [Gemmatimonadaceae bacterium]|nr:carboxypeptidase regulatory-like domain-containing protein [Gemmatimonadaceae bacterium]
MSTGVRAGCAALVALCAAATVHAQGTADVLRGTVRSDSGRTIAGALVAVTRGSDRAVEQTATDSLGRWMVRFAEGTGDYLVFSSAAGFRSARRRVTRVADEREFRVDLVLPTAVVATLAAVRVQAPPPPRPQATVRANGEEVGASERWVDGVAASVAPTARGNLAAIAATAPGLTIGADGASLLGASAGSNLATLNGLAIGSTTLPRAANADVRISGTSFDPTRGGFAGAQVDVQLAAGDRDLQQRNLFQTFDAPPLQATDAVGRALGVRALTSRTSIGADGQLLGRPYSYNTAIDYARTERTPRTWLDADAATLTLGGLAPDSATRLRRVAEGVGVPLDGRGAPRARVDESLTWLARVDNVRDTLRTLAVTTIAQLDRRGALGRALTTAPAASAEATDLSGGVQLHHVHFTGREQRIFNEQRAAVSMQRQRTTPYLPLPSAQLLVGTARDGTDDIVSVALGGDAFAVRDARQWTVEAQHQTIWLARGTRHRFTLAAWGRADGVRDDGVPNAAGSLLFPSIDALSTGRAASFTRTLAQPARDGRAVNGALSGAHRWAPSRRFQLLYGARLEGARFLDAPRANDALAQAIGVRTARLPATVRVSPRAGFTWRPLDRGVSQGNMTNNMGQFFRPSTNIVRGGIGLFRDLYRPQVVADARAATGAAGSTLVLRCVGAATPLADWGGWLASPGTIPGDCVGGGALLDERAPTVRAVAPDFDVPRSWRANLNWMTAALGWIVRVEAIGARNLSQPSVIDRNLDRTTRFTLDDGRPVFAPLAAIDPASGVASTAASRRTPAFGRVRELGSDLESRGAQLSLGVSRDIFAGGRRVIGATYVWQRVRQQFRGSDGAGAGDPVLREWARGDNDVRHAIVFQAGVLLPRGANLAIFGRVQSGLPFTPVVAGDLDGDGVAGDRAALVDPARDVDPARAAGMRTLLAALPAAARRCVERQFGTIAARNSCIGPWTQTLNARIEVPLPNALAGRRTQFSLQLSNPLAGIDQLVHGADNLKGWGAPGRPDPTLLVVRGFDPVARRYRFDVNPRFGQTSVARTLLRDPFRVTMDVAVDLTRDRALQRLERSVEPARRNGQWVRPPVDTVLRFYLARVSSVHRVLLFNSDTLFLTRAQVERLAAADTLFQREVRALFQPVAADLAALPMGAPTRPMLAKVRAAEERYARLFYAQRDTVQAVLTTLQRSVMPEFIKDIVGENLARPWDRWAVYRFDDRGQSISISRN